MRHIKTLLLTSAIFGLAACSGGEPAGSAPDTDADTQITTVSVPASAETEPVGTTGDDAADDPAIWFNSEDPSKSLIIGTDKKAGIYVYDMAGKVKSYLAAGEVNNIDLREVTMQGERHILVGASDRQDEKNAHIALFLLDPETGKLSPAARAPVGTGEAYGFCFGKGSGALPVAYTITKEGAVLEADLIEEGGNIAVMARDGKRKVASQAEGCVVDDRTDTLYLGEENAAIWSFALGDDFVEPKKLAKIDDAQLFADVEGLALAQEGETGGYVVASSQGDNSYAVYRLPEFSFAGRFRIEGGDIDGTSETDGIELKLGNFGPDYPEGLFVVQDGDNGDGTQNFKYVSWKAIKDALGL